MEKTFEIVKGRKHYYKCPKCGDDKKLLSIYCPACYKAKYGSKRINKEYEKLLEDSLIEFVNRIEDRSGMASMYEIFVELITIYNHFCYFNEMDSLEPTDQIILMWSMIKKEKNKIETKNKQKEYLD